MNFIKTESETKSTRKDYLEKIKELKQLYYLGSNDAHTIVTSEANLENKLNKIGEVISKKSHIKKSQDFFQPTPENITRLHYPISSALNSLKLDELTEENIKIFDLFNITSEKSLLSKLSKLSFISDIFIPVKNNHQTEDDILKMYGSYYSEVFKDINNTDTNIMHDILRIRSKNQNITVKIKKGINSVLNLFEENQNSKNIQITQILQIQPNFISKLKNISRNIKKINSSENMSLSLIKSSEVLKHNPEFLSTLFFIGGYIAPNRQLYNQILCRDLENQELMFKTLHKINSFLNEITLGLILSNYTTFQEVEQIYKKETINHVLSPMNVTTKILNEGLYKRKEFEDPIIKILLTKAKLKDENITYESLIKNIAMEIHDTETNLKINELLIKQNKNIKISDIFKPRTEEELIAIKKDLYQKIQALNLIYKIFISNEENIKSLMRKE